MKKVLLIFSVALVVILTSCEKTSTSLPTNTSANTTINTTEYLSTNVDEYIVGDDMLYLEMDEISLSLDTFETDNSKYPQYSQNYLDIKEEILESLIIGDDVDLNAYLMISNQTYNRDDLNLTSQEIHNIDIHFNKFAIGFSSLINQFDDFVSYCNLDSVCQAPLDFYNDTIINLDYGFSDTSAFYSVDYIDDEQVVTETEIGKFNILNDNVEYEIIIIDYEESNLAYTIGYDNQYRRYTYNTDDASYSFEYSNLENYLNFFYKKYADGKEYIYYYNPETGYLLQQNDNNTKVAKFDGLDWVAEIESYDSEYVACFNFNYIPGWDSILYRGSSSPDNVLYNNEVEVFTDYDIYVQNYTSVITIVYSRAELGEDIGDYIFPSNFSGDVNVSDLLNHINGLEDSDYILNLVDLTREEIQEQCVYMFDAYLN